MDKPRRSVSFERISGGSSGFVCVSSRNERYVNLLFVYRVNSRKNGFPPCSHRGRGVWQPWQRRHESKFNWYTSLFFPFSYKNNLSYKNERLLRFSDGYIPVFLHPGLIFVFFMRVYLSYKASSSGAGLVCANSWLNEYGMSCRSRFDSW